MAALAEALRSIGTEPIRHIVNVSGGKDSSALAIYLRQHYPQIPAEYVFCDTGAELPETYDYLDRLEALLGAQIVRLSALEKLGVQEKPGRTPFDIYLSQVFGGFLPNPRSRWCTRALKIEPFERYVGESRAYSYIGIRADENRRGYVARKPPVISQQPNIIPVYPLRDDGLKLADIQRILEGSGLGVPEYYQWRSRSGCYFCFYQQVGEWQGLQAVHPDLFEKSAAYEKAEGDRRFTWVAGKSLRQIVSQPHSRLPDPDDEAGCAVCHL